ncbi:hypothetical protein TRVA0_001S01684 [Trichomonascus vanleenenianus]|uniref:uncharacterized protein n=1 Tax=Trichomonascus vanleenenianus TaxID=2268995 RepID=UPI003ECB97DE
MPKNTAPSKSGGREEDLHATPTTQPIHSTAAQNDSLEPLSPIRDVMHNDPDIEQVDSTLTLHEDEESDASASLILLSD